VIAAPPEQVWPHVLAFRPIPEPTEAVFRLGIAYPTYARIEGSGVGAVRYCVFSTGAFVEPITRWEPGKRLSFDVTASPAPLREFSLYPQIARPISTAICARVAENSVSSRFLAAVLASKAALGTTWRWRPNATGSFGAIS
jgi:hypothetical protein